MVRWVVGSILHGVDPLSYFSFQRWGTTGAGDIRSVFWRWGRLELATPEVYFGVGEDWSWRHPKCTLALGKTGAGDTRSVLRNHAHSALVTKRLCIYRIQSTLQTSSPLVFPELAKFPNSVTDEHSCM